MVLLFYFVDSLSFLFNLISSSFAACLSPFCEFARGELSARARGSAVGNVLCCYYYLWNLIYIARIRVNVDVQPATYRAPILVVSRIPSPAKTARSISACTAELCASDTPLAPADRWRLTFALR